MRHVVHNINTTAISICVAILLTLAFVAPAHAAKRVALVIGNSAYKKLPALANPRNDARLMARTLRDLGFEVISALDADRTQIGRAIRKFGKTLRTSGKDTVGLFYFAGHGVQARGTNYLVPLGAAIDDEADLALETVSASNVLAQMETAGNALNLISLDACRNNPFKGKVRSASRGLARVQAASGSLVAFAAAPGQVAADGTGVNSPYTKALAKAMRIPGLTVEQMFKRVRVSVEDQTNNRQTPWEESSLRGDFYFTPGTIAAAPNTKPIPKLKDTGAVEAAQIWRTIKDTKNIRILQAFEKRYHQSFFATLAHERIREIKRRVIASRANSDNKTEQRKPATMSEKLALIQTQPLWQHSAMHQGQIVASASNRKGNIFAITCNWGYDNKRPQFMNFSLIKVKQKRPKQITQANLLITVDEQVYQFTARAQAGYPSGVKFQVDNNGTRDAELSFDRFESALKFGRFMSVASERFGIYEIFSLKKAHASLWACRAKL